MAHSSPLTAHDSRNEEARTLEAGFFKRLYFLRERRYADLGYLLPMFYVELAIEPGVSALPAGWPAIHSLSRVHQTDKPLDVRIS
jgi:hypothetical protein